MYNLTSLLGMFGLIGIAWIFSTARKAVEWRIVVWGLVCQLVFAVFIFWLPLGVHIFNIMNNAALFIIQASTAGSEFLFGPLAKGPGQEGSLGFILAIQAFPTIIFFSALIGVFYYIGLMQQVIRGFSFLFSKLMRISGAESFAAAATIFVGIESLLTVKPFLRKMTESEYCTILTAGLSTVASNVLALYVFTLQSEFPNIAAHLISASLLSAPAALIMSKVLLPETEKTETFGLVITDTTKAQGSLFETIIQSSMQGIKMIAGIAAVLIAVLGLTQLVNMTLGALGNGVNALSGWNLTWSLENLLGILFFPLTLLLGIPFEDVYAVSRIIGERLILTEVVSYQHLSQLLETKALSSPRSAVITTYALCGFTHLASLAIFVGGLTALVPDRTRQITKVAFRSLFAATLACLMTACIAGIFYSSHSVIFGG